MELGRNLCRNEAPFDLVLSHTCPYPYEPTDLFLAGLDQSTVDSTMERYLGEIEFNLDYKRWAFGHFHADRLYPWADGRQMLMLFNENVVNLDKFMNMTENSRLKILLHKRANVAQKPKPHQFFAGTLFVNTTLLPALFYMEAPKFAIVIK